MIYLVSVKLALIENRINQLPSNLFNKQSVSEIKQGSDISMDGIVETGATTVDKVLLPEN